VRDPSAKHREVKIGRRKRKRREEEEEEG